MAAEDPELRPFAADDPGHDRFDASLAQAQLCRGQDREPSGEFDPPRLGEAAFPVPGQEPQGHRAVRTDEDVVPPVAVEVSTEEEVRRGRQAGRQDRRLERCAGGR